MEDMRNELRTALSELGPRGRGRAYPKGLLEKVLTYTVARRRQGAKLVEVAAELALSDQTLSRWLGEKRASTKFVQVVAAPAAASVPIAAPAIVVHGARGLRIEGLDLAAVAECVFRSDSSSRSGSTRAVIPAHPSTDSGALEHLFRRT